MSKTKTNTLDKKAVFVGLSGGVDSAVSAYLLKKEGYKVVGAFIKTWLPEGYPCSWKEERRDAMRVAAHLEIPFITIDLEKEYKENVADYMISEYKAGRTPNPDVMCNKEIKFGGFLKKALEMGANLVATGHYAQNLKKGSEFFLCKAKDVEKEQSYFLWTLTQEQLSKIIFPIGHLKKTEVRKIAKKIGLPNAEKKDSQGICFLGDIDMKKFLKEQIKTEIGKVLNTEGEEIGIHDGAVFYTIGERHGFTITKKTPNDEKLFVVSKSLKTNTITVSKEADLKKTEGNITKKITLEKTNWVTKEPEENKFYTAQIRYHQILQKVKIFKENNEFIVLFSEPQTGASGQSVVIYDKNICLGGGVIK